MSTCVCGGVLAMGQSGEYAPGFGVFKVCREEEKGVVDRCVWELGLSRV